MNINIIDMNCLITEANIKTLFDVTQYNLNENDTRVHQFKIGEFKVVINEVITTEIKNDKCELWVYPDHKTDGCYYKEFVNNCDMAESLREFIETYTKPTVIALRERKEWIGERIGEIHACIDSYIFHKIDVPLEWYDELEDHQNVLKFYNAE